MALGVLQSPGELGADIAVGDAQSLGIPLGFGGPSAGIFTTKEKFVRFMPGRLVGETVDARGERAYTLTLGPREQHIRREQATSNICTNQALCALMSAIYMAIMGAEGMRGVAKQCAYGAHYLAGKIKERKYFWLRFSGEFFNEFLVETSVPIEKVKIGFEKKGILALFQNDAFRIPGNTFLIAVTEKRTKEECDYVIEALKEVEREHDGLE